MTTFSGMDISRKQEREREEVTEAGGCDDDGEGQKEWLGTSTTSCNDVT